MKTQYVWAVLEMPAMSQQQILQAQYKFSKPYLAKKTKKKQRFLGGAAIHKNRSTREKKTTAFEHIDMPHRKYYGNPKPFPPVAFMMQHAE